MSNIIIPGKKYLEVNREIELPAIRVKGFYTVRVLRNDKSCRAEYKFPNLILNSGLNRIGSTGAIGYFHIGSANNEPAYTDTQLYGHIKSANVYSTNMSAASTPPYHGIRTMSGQYTPSDGIPNNTIIAEIGMSSANTNAGAPFWSRELIRDINGNATTITMQSDEYLDVAYTVHTYAPTDDVTQNNVTITGVGSRNVTLRAAYATSQGYWAYGGTQVNATGSTYVFTGSLGPITGAPSGTSGGGTQALVGTYANNSYERYQKSTWSLDSGNVAIKSFIFGNYYGAYQCEFDTAFTKLNTQILTLTYKISWARYP